MEIKKEFRFLLACLTALGVLILMVWLVNFVVLGGP